MRLPNNMFYYMQNLASHPFFYSSCIYNNHCFFVFPIKNLEPLDQFAINFDLGNCFLIRAGTIIS